MKFIQNTGLFLLLAAFTLFNAVIFMGNFNIEEAQIEQLVKKKGIKSEFFIENSSELLGNYDNFWEPSQKLITLAEKSHDFHVSKIREMEDEGVHQDSINQEWSKVIWLKSTKQHGQYSYPLLKASGAGFVVENKFLLFLLSFGLGIFAGLLYVIPSIALKGPAGIKNNGVFQNPATSRAWIAWLIFAYLISFYIVLYFFPNALVNLTFILDPLSSLLNGGQASQWFLYGVLYCSFMLVMGIKMIIKYRHNNYQIIRSLSVLFFQFGFAFLIPELMSKYGLPWYDFKNAWPLDYTFFFQYNIDKLLASGNFGLFILVWGVVLTLLIVPIMVYFYGKRWYCSWVCGCGGLAETAGDPFRQHSDKSTKAWKVERYLIYSVLLFAIFMTIASLSKGKYFLGMNTDDLRFWYGFAIGSIFSGVIGTGFYPIFGNRVWCRFGCPLAAYMGIVQRFKSRFRITTNGAQCISCGNCSTYCEQGIDVRAYAQKGQNIVRASCVGCGICSAVCPRGVLKLENGPSENRVIDNPIVIDEDGIRLNN